MTLFDSLRPYLPRLIANVVAAVCTWLFTKYGLKVRPETQQLVGEILLALVAYMMVRDPTHRLFSKKMNPNDAASKHLAVAGMEHRRALDIGKDKIPRNR